MKSESVFFYKSIPNIVGIKEITKLVEKENMTLGKYVYQDLTLGFLDTEINSQGLNIFTNILGLSFEIEIPNKKINDFKRSLNDLVNKELREIPTVSVKYTYKDKEISFEITNQIPYKSMVERAENIISPMIELLFLARAKIIFFLLEHKQIK